MSWNARRFQPGKPILRAVRHRKKRLTKAAEEALAFAPPTESEINTAIMHASDLKLHRWAAILRLADQYREVDRQRLEYKEAYLGTQAEVECWKLKYLMERQKVRALERKIGSLKQRRQNSRTRMRAGVRIIPTTFPNSKRSSLLRRR